MLRIVIKEAVKGKSLGRIDQFQFASAKPLEQLHLCLLFRSSSTATAIVNGHSRLSEDPESPIIRRDDFRNTFRFRSLSELARSLFVFRLCSYQTLVKNSLTLMNLGEKVLGRRLFFRLMKGTFYGQFVGGENASELMGTIEKLRGVGLGPLLAVPMEEDVGSHSTPDAQYDRNLATILDCVSVCHQIDRNYPMMQIKLTALLPGDVCAHMSQLVPDPSGQPEIVEHIASVFSNRDRIIFDGLDSSELVALEKGIERLRAVCQRAVELGVTIQVDAEYTYLNPALNLLSLAMMLAYNQQRPLVAYTYQNYLKDTFKRLEADVNFIRSRDVCFGAKVVRGAYINKERHLAATNDYSDPCHPTFDGTSAMYRQSVDLLLDRVKKDGDKLFVIFGTHNEDSVNYILDGMRKREIHPKCGSVFLGQVFGMCDYISSPLGQAGYLAYKSVPFGSLEDTMPYLQRRALENQSLLGGTQKERQLLWKAFLDRLTGGLLPRK